MALQKEYNYKGVTSNYWKILNYTQNTVTNKTVVCLGLYKDSNSRNQSVENVLTTNNIQLNGSNLTLSQIYTEILSLNEWNSSQSV